MPDEFSPAYDDDGNTTTTQLRYNGTPYEATLVWAGENRLIEVLADTTTKAVYQYDHLWRRIAKKVDGTTIWFIYDGWNFVAEYGQVSTNAPTLERRYTWGLDLAGLTGGGSQDAGGAGGLLSIRDIDSTIDFLPSYDGNGNVTQLVRPLSGMPRT